MKLPVIRDGLSPDRGAATVRPVLRIKKSLATSLCAGATASWAQTPRASSPYRFGEGCFCLSPEQHGAQFQQDSWERPSLKGHC